MTTPTDRDYVDLINVTKEGAPVPDGWRKLSVAANPDHRERLDHGLEADTFVNAVTGHVVIAFAARTTSPYFGTSVGSKAQADSDTAIMNGKIPEGLSEDIADYVRRAREAIAKENVSNDSSNIFVTGNSLGGFEAQLAARDNGFGGASFGGPGIPDIVAQETTDLSHT
jgi:hypothetical protein